MNTNPGNAPQPKTSARPSDTQPKVDAGKAAPGGTQDPSWWKDDKHGAAWERAQPGVSRSWGQAKPQPKPSGNPIMGKDLGGELEGKGRGQPQQSGTGQSTGTTAGQDTSATGMGSRSAGGLASTNQHTPLSDESHDADSLRFGVGARQQYGDQHPTWNPQLEQQLQSDWQVDSGQSSPDRLRKDWNEAKYGVRHGYEYNAKEDGKPSK